MHTIVDPPLSTYEGSLYGVTMTVEQGMDDYDQCYWKATARYSATGQHIETEVVYIDHEEVTCLSPPFEIAIPIDGPSGCTGGTLILDDFSKARLPFIERYEPDFPYWHKFINLCPSDCEVGETFSELAIQDIWDPTNEFGYIVYTSAGTENGFQKFTLGDYKLYWRMSPYVADRWVIVDTSTDEEVAWGNIGACPLGVWTTDDPDDPDDDGRIFCVSRTDDVMLTCGECLQVCSKVCVDGYRHLTGAMERAEFIWFIRDDGRRGWFYANPTTGHTEYLWFEEDGYGNCTIIPDFRNEEVQEEELWDAREIDLCSCGLQEAWWEVIGGNLYMMTVRCGRCSCWDHLCGSCRCIPSKLCVVLVTGTTVQRVIVTWDLENRWWGEEDGPIRLHLARNGLDCEITADVTGYYPLEQTYKFNCRPPEALWNIFNPEHDFLAFQLADDDNQIIAIVSGLLPECSYGPCGDATPCNADCGGHPQFVTANIRVWRQVGDVSDPYIPADECSIDVGMIYWETASYIPGKGVENHCGYVGWAFMPNLDDCFYDAFKVTLSRAVFQVQPYKEGEAQGSPASFTLDSEECDPYVGLYLHPYTFGVPVDPGFNVQCLGCDNYGHFRMEITITE